MANRKSSREARRVVGAPHWRSNTQFQVKDPKTGRWEVVETRSWAAFRYHLSRKGCL